jgi:hypothetical protein
MPEMNEPIDADAGIGAIFDFSFQRFITLSVIKVLFMLGILLIALEWLAMVILGFTTGGTMGGVGALIIGTVACFIAVIFLRVWLELIVVIFRIGENTSKLVEQKEGGPSIVPLGS